MTELLMQGTEEWLRARAGKITASRMADLTAKTKSGYSASRKNYLAQLVIERMTGEPTESFVSREMLWGIEHEPEARTLYEWTVTEPVIQVGFIRHPELNSGASPDGEVGDDGGVELKCPNSATHIETILTNIIPQRYLYQMQWCMECTGRKWWDYVSYDPRMRVEKLTLYRTRVMRDDSLLAELREEVRKAEEEIQATIARLTAAAEQGIV